MRKKNTSKKVNITNFNKAINISLIISLIGSIYWFLNFPLYRYGYSLFVSGVIILISHSISNYFTNNKKLKT